MPKEHLNRSKSCATLRQVQTTNNSFVNFSVPYDYDEALAEYTKQGLRVIACGYKEFPDSWEQFAR
jgi:hypothetical protein